MSESLDNMSNKLSPIFSSIAAKFNEPKLEMHQTRSERITQSNVDNESVEPNVDINSNRTIQAETSIEMPNRKILHGIAHSATSTLGLILLYFTLSIGLSFYQRKLLKVNITSNDSPHISFSVEIFYSSNVLKTL